MKIRLFIFLSLLLPTIALSQVIFRNNIDGPDPSDTNPFTALQYHDPNITVTGISYSGVTKSVVTNDRFNTDGWNSPSINTSDYFEFTLAPKFGYKINFSNFICNTTISGTGPKQFAYSTSLDGFISNEGSIKLIDLGTPSYQGISSSITFRLYGWGATTAAGTFSIDDFSFSGSVIACLEAPTIVILSQPQCKLITTGIPEVGGSIELSGLPATGSWDLYQNGVKIVTDGTGTTTTVSDLAVETYNFKVVQGGCSSRTTPNITLDIPTTTWNGTIWSNDPPDENKHVIFGGNYSSSGDISACTCRIDSGVTISSGNTFKVNRELNVTNTGSLTFEDGASLVQFDDASINSGEIIYKRNTTAVSNLDYTYWSSPVEHQSLFNLSPQTLSDKFYSFNPEIRNWKQENSSVEMFPGRGYIIRGPESHVAPAAPSPYTASFKGVPNTGLYFVPIGEAGTFNLLGNPYPSALDANAFLATNETVLEGTIYFWTHNTPIRQSAIASGIAGLGEYRYTSDDYAAYNLTGGVATQAPSSGKPGAVNSNVPSGKIASGQAFFAVSKASDKFTNCVFSNEMRVGVGTITGNNSQFFRPASSAKEASVIENSRMWLDLTNNQGAFKQILIGYVAGATNSFDSRFDGPSFNGNSFIDFYSRVDNKNFVIQGRALPFNEAEEVPLGFQSSIKGEFKIGLAEVDGFLSDKKVYLKDKLLNLVHDLKSSPYTFATEIGTFNNRFIVSYQNKTLSNSDVDFQAEEVLISSKDKTISVTTTSELIDEITVYSIDGKQLFRKSKISVPRFTIDSIAPIGQLLVVKVGLKNGSSTSQKLVF